MKKKQRLHAALAFCAALLFLHPTPLFSFDNDAGQFEESEQLPYESAEPVEQDEYVPAPEEEAALMDEAEGVPGEEEYLPEMTGEEEAVEGEEEEYVPETYDEEVVPESAEGEAHLEAEGDNAYPEEEYLPEIEGEEPAAAEQ